MPATILVSTALAEVLSDAIKDATVTATITTSANAVLWTGTVSKTDTATDGSFTITTAAAAATATGTPAQVKFYDGSSVYQWKTTIGNGSNFGFQFTGDITSGNSYQFTSTPIAYTTTAENA
jgi:hypothetical protein